METPLLEPKSGKENLFCDFKKNAFYDFWQSKSKMSCLNQNCSAVLSLLFTCGEPSQCGDFTSSQ